MIRFRGERDGRKFVAIGLSRGNMDKLLDGQPIVINFETEFGMPDTHLDLFVMGGETEQSMADELVALGMLRPETITHRERRARQ